MSVEICVRIPDGPDVVRHIGEMSHHAMVIGADLRMRKIADDPVALLAQPPAPQDPEPGDLTGLSVSEDPVPTPAGGNRRGRGRG